MRAVLDIEELPVTDSIEFLRERMLRAPVPLLLEPRPHEDLVVRSRVADLGQIHLLCTKAQGGDVVRTADLARDDARPSLMVSAIDHGTARIIRGDQVTTLNAGDIGLYATAEPTGSASPPEPSDSPQIPLDELGLPWEMMSRQLQVAVLPDTVTTAAVSAFLRSTARNAPRASKAELASLERLTMDLIRLLLTRVEPDAPAGRGAAAASLAARIEEHVRSRLGDPDLSARSVAECFSISERYVYLILARRGIDLGEAIRRYRLERAVRLLEDPAQMGLTVAAVAHRCGFTDHSHFSRAFRARFGTSPSEWRRRVQAYGASDLETPTVNRTPGLADRALTTSWPSASRHMRRRAGALRPISIRPMLDVLPWVPLSTNRPSPDTDTPLDRGIVTTC